MSNGCTIVRVDADGFVPYPFGTDTGMLTEDRAKSLAWTLAHDLPGTEIGVLDGGTLVESFLIGDKDWIPTWPR